MAEPKKKLSRSRSGHKKSHLALKKKNLSSCPKCNSTKLSHYICENCGFYKNEKIINVK